MSRGAHLLALALWLAPLLARADGFDFRAPADAGSDEASAAMRDLAGRVLPVYKDDNPDRYLANLSALQLVAGNYGAADGTRRSLQDRRRTGGASVARADPRAALIDLYAHARALEADQHISFGQAFTQSFNEAVPALGDRDAYGITAWLGAPPASFQEALQRSFDRLRGREHVEQPEAIHLVWAWLSLDAWRSFGALLGQLGADDDRRRYFVDEDVAIKAGDGAVLHARVVRPRNVTGPVPALLEFTLFAAPNDAKACAAHGYAGVVAYTRGKNFAEGAGPSQAAVPFQHDGDDARAVIDWIAKQPWSDGSVGMYGGGYGGFTAWAVAKRLPEALKAIATEDALAPGIDFPMAGGIFRNTAYRWAVTNASSQPEAAGDDASWRALDEAWYASGEPYRALETLAKKPSPLFREWLAHPAYDAFWRQLVPSQEQFAAIDIPVLAMTGNGGDDAGTLHYFEQHLRALPDADHTLLIGGYDDSTLLDGPSALLRGYPPDPAALLDLRELRYQWFDHVLKGAARPALLQDRVNYEVMGVNEWRHAPSLAAMANGSLKLYFDPATIAGRQRLATAPLPKASLTQKVDLRDRRDAKAPLPADLLRRSLAPGHAMVYVSEPLPQATEVAGLLSGRLDFKVNKADVDVSLAVYELRANGDYLEVFDACDFRASYARDPGHRHLLVAGKLQHLGFRCGEVASLKLQPGSRLVLVLDVNRRPDRQVNYGSGKDVSDESIADARTPVTLRWYGSSYVEIPVRR